MTVSETTSPVKKLKPRLTSAFKQLWSLHWWMALCYLLLFVVGAIMADLPREYIVRKHAYIFHKSLGALTLGLLTLRIFILQRVWWRKYTHRLPKFTSKWIRRFLLHALIYLFMLAVPISGFFLSNSFQSNNVSFFWIVKLPDIFPENKEILGLARNMHFWLSYTFLGFIVLHAIDQLKYLRSLWRRMSGAFKK
ncbi:MAG: cytochrome b [Cyanobacteria bacterium SBLK]|nr:cytochrome b [Cyanobacteria bacterium SBLK]